MKTEWFNLNGEYKQYCDTKKRNKKLNDKEELCDSMWWLWYVIRVVQDGLIRGQNIFSFWEKKKKKKRENSSCGRKC